MKKHLIFEKWYVLSEPWGTGSAILAGNCDPHLGEIVCSNENAFYNPEGYQVDDIGTFVSGIMHHIVKVHNEWLMEWERNYIGAVSNADALVD